MRVGVHEPVVTSWLRVIKGVKRPVVHGKNVHKPGAQFTRKLHTNVDDAPVIPTPCSFWDSGGHVGFGCSFCHRVCTGSTHIQFNPVMTRPFIFTCGQCQPAVSVNPRSVSTRGQCQPAVSVNPRSVSTRGQKMTEPN